MMEVIKMFLPDLIQYAVQVLVGVVSVLSIRLIRKYNLENTVKKAVYYAEQRIKGDKVGDERYEFVTDYVKSKFKISDEQLDLLIESVVAGINLAKNKKA